MFSTCVVNYKPHDIFPTKKQFFSSIFLARLKVYCAIFRNSNIFDEMLRLRHVSPRSLVRLVLFCVPPGLLRLFLSTQSRNMYNMSHMKDNIKLDAILQNGNRKRRRSVFPQLISIFVICVIDHKIIYIYIYTYTYILLNLL